MPVPPSVLKRDSENAVLAQKLAREQKGQSIYVQSASRARYAYLLDKSIDAILVKPFDVMVEVDVELDSGEEVRHLWYGHEGVEVNMPLNGSVVPILAWTHPGLQAALASDLNDQEDLHRSGLKIIAVTPTRRARFTRAVPDIQGMYEPGGSVGLAPTSRPEKKAGLKAVKLDMTYEQMRAFTSQMQGIMLVTGAPGSGKTTIAYQRIRFLLDQQDQMSKQLPIAYEISGVRVFLANRNLMNYSQRLLTEELGLERNPISLVPDFVSGYIVRAWKHKWGAKPTQKKLNRIEERARDAVFGLIDESHLKDLWKSYENQVRIRLKNKSQMTWAIVARSKAHTLRLQESIVKYAEAIVSGDDGPKKTAIKIDRLYSAVHKEYDVLRNSLEEKTRSKFDGEFAKWLYYAYDPLHAMHAYLKNTRYKAKTRVERGIAGRGNAEKLVDVVVHDLDDRIYSPADQATIAFLLRFALPEETEGSKRFREVPEAWPEQTPWTHLVIDEAQDLSAPEAALLTSLVDNRGALTISADFRQRVSAAHGIDGPASLLLGCKISTEGMSKPFRFAVNKRQTPQIARFLMAFYEANFGEVPPFNEDKEAVSQLMPPKPELFIGNHQSIRERLKQMRNLLSRNADATVAVVQINEDADEKRRIEGYLESIQIEPVEPGQRNNTLGNQWVLATVEEIKGLEFDTCFVFGLDSVDAAELDYNLNRAYVALSRPAFRLSMFCQEFPALLRGIPADRYDKRDTTQ